MSDSVNAPLGLAFDVVSGIVMAALPGGPLAKGLAFGLIAWFFRVAMGVGAQAVMFRAPAELTGCSSGQGPQRSSKS